VTNYYDRARSGRRPLDRDGRRDGAQARPGVGARTGGRLKIPGNRGRRACAPTGSRRGGRPGAGTAVAHQPVVRPMFLAWLALALILLGIGTMTHASGRLRATPAESASR